MAKKATSGGGTGSGGNTARKSGKASGKASSSRALARTSSGGGQSRSGSSTKDTMGEAFIKLLQSPLVADLLAVAATAALAALAEHGFSSRGGDDGAKNRRAGKAVKEAGKAAAAAIGRRLSTEMEEIREAAKASSAKA